MLTSFTEYKLEVLAYYDKKKYSDALDDLLASPSPVNLRTYCLIRLSEGLPQSDIDILQKFFDPFKKEATLEKAIATFNPGYLKALQNLIMNKTRNPQDLLVKLLAILVDYQPRPFRYTYPIASAPPEKEEVRSIPRTERPPTARLQKKLMKRVNRLLQRYALPICGTSAIGLLLYFVTSNIIVGEDCMRWNGERYIAVRCQAKPQQYPIIALNEDQLRNFQKILQEDTISTREEARVWYSEIENEVEFFTYHVFHPVDTRQSFKLTNAYIILKYALQEN